MSVIDNELAIDLDQMASDFHTSVNRRNRNERIVNWAILAGTLVLAVILVLFA